MKMCEECGVNPANVHLTQIVQNETVVKHLCEECAKAMGISVVIKGPVDLLEKCEVEPEKHAKVTCPQCHMTLDEFKERGKLGCALCYVAFSEDIGELLMQAHGARCHRGKQYHAILEVGVRKTDIICLRNELAEAVRSEQFERAAALRDRIKGISAGKPVDSVQD